MRRWNATVLPGGSRAVAALSASLLAVAALTVSATADSDGRAQSDGPEPGTRLRWGTSPPTVEVPQGDLADADALLDTLALPPVSGEMSDLASSITQRYHDDPRFSAVEVTQARDLLIVHWYGHPDDGLLQMAESSPEVPVEIRSTEFEPGELRAATQALVRDNPAVTMAAPHPDGSGIIVWIVDDASISEQRHLIGQAYPFPVTVEVGSVVPADTR